MIVKCKQCGLELTEDIHPLTDPSLINRQDGEILLPAGFYLIEDGSYLTQQTGNIIVSSLSVINTIDHFDKRRTQGCCGVGTTDNNQTCKNRHEIGTLYEDCWTPCAMLFNPQLVTITESISLVE